MQQYGVADVEKLLRLPRSTIRALVAAGFVSPTRGPRKTLRFSFQDLIVLRTAQTLSAARVPAKRITRSLKELRRQLPESMPLSGLSIGAVGEHVVVKDGSGRRRADSGQYLLAFEGDPASGTLSVIERPPLPATDDDSQETDWLQQAATLEADDAEAALKAYAKAIKADRECIEAHINLGRLLHELQRLPQAERAYREGLAICGDDAVLLYNLGVLLDDMGRKPEAADCYKSALAQDPDLADCHYNLALLYEELARPQEAIRHMSQYRRLTSQS